MKSDKYNIFCIRIIKLLKKFTTISSTHYNNGRRFDWDKRSQNCLFYWPEHFDERLKDEIKFIIKNSDSLAESKIKNEIEQLLLKHKHGNNIHEHGKQ